MQVLLSNVVVDPIDPAFQCREISLNGVGCYTNALLATDVFSGPMVDLIVSALHQGTRQHCRAIRHYAGIFSNHLVNDWPQVLSRDALYVPGLHATAAL